MTYSDDSTFVEQHVTTIVVALVTLLGGLTILARVASLGAQLAQAVR